MHIIKTENKKEKGAFSAFLRHVFTNHAFESSATLSYYFLFSIFPLAIFISASFSTLNFSKESLVFLSSFVPDYVLNILEGYLREISQGNTTSLILMGILLTLFSMVKVIQTMKRKFRLAYGITRKTKTASDWIVSMVFVLLVMVSFYAMLFLVTLGNQLIRWAAAALPFMTDFAEPFRFLQFIFITSYLFFVLLGLYYLLPGFMQKKRNVLPGTLFSLVAWVLTSYLFSFYLERFSNLTTLYGSLSAIIVLLTWLYLINLILLIGVYINSYLYLSRRKST